MAHPEFSLTRLASTLLLISAGSLLAGCGGSTGTSPAQTGSSGAAVSTTTLNFGMSAADAASTAMVSMHPTYHLAPVLPDVPTAIDADGSSASAKRAPGRKLIPAFAHRASTRELGLDQLVSGETVDFSADTGTATSSVTYSPAQVRAAYGLPTLPSSYANLSAAQLAQYGAGQTVYIIDANDDQQIAGELGAFSQLFGLPACGTNSLASSAQLPLAAPSGNSCDFYKVYSNAGGTISNTAPAFDANWAVEIALDVQWVHAIAPLARIVLIETPDASFASLSGGIQLANQMGPGVVSMSFGGAEGSYVLAADSLFQAPHMSYFAATGDNGEAVSWPSVSPYVVGVGGTTLTYTGTGSRTEVTWSGTGGGVSAYEPTPIYQNSSVPGMQSYGKRVVADVAFNANPNSGQYVAVISNQTTCTFCQVSWVTAGGTSLATPQWAGIAAVVNAMRVNTGAAMLGDPHAFLYNQIAATTTSYAANLYDVKTGTDGSCTVCSAKTGFDIPTGLGTPNTASLITTLTGLKTASAPVVSGGISVSAIAGKALTFTASVTDPTPYTMSLQNAPAGMTVSSKGVVTWSNPAIGNYTVNVVARDTQTGLSGQGTYSVFVASGAAPIVSAGTVAGTVGQALSFAVIVSDLNPTTLSLTGAPSGMTISSGGVVTWNSPVAGTYSLSVTAKDMMNGLSTKGSYSIIINKTAGPVVSAGNISGTAGVALSFPVTLTNTNPVTWSLAGAPSGMTISTSGTVQWSKPVAGNFIVSVVARDSKTGLVGTGSYALTINAATGPTFTSIGLTGKAGTPLHGSFQIGDNGSYIVGVGVGGAPLGMAVSGAGSMSNFTVDWSNPVAGTYALQVSATDAAGHSGSADLIVTITN